MQKLNNMGYPEILAPAGSMDSLYAAVRCGADAVYLGGKSFNARRGAGNFSDDELLYAIHYCHARNVKVYLTLNTLVSDSELAEAKAVIKRACTFGADALILQDIGLSGLAAEISDMPLHASTQMSVQTPEGINTLSDMGFCRAVLPRELSRGEIEKISASTDIELEMFVHGALCMCVSGQCYFSSVLGSRSGNRGLCAQPCRLPFEVSNGTGHDLSLKDLSLLQHLPQLAESGITSFKIEGRMKRPEYVAAAVTACRKALDGDFSGEIFDDLRSVFSRSGFTDGYYTGKTGRDMFGTRGRDDVTSASPAVLSKLQRLYDKENQTVPVSFKFICRSDGMSLTASSGTVSVTEKSDFIPSPAVNRPLSREKSDEQLSKCGGTQFCITDIVSEIEDGLNVPLSEINLLRRGVLSSLTEKLCEGFEKSVSENSSELPASSPHRLTKIYARFSSASQIPDNASGVSKIILPLYSDIDAFKTYGACAELPRGIFGFSEKVLKRLETLKEAGVSEALCGTIDAISLASEAEMKIIAGFGTNIYNSRSLSEINALGADECIVSAELTLGEISRLGGSVRRGIFAYGRLPLMLTRNCPQRNGTSCDTCRRTGDITDRKGIHFPIECVSGCSEILNSLPLYLADRLSEIKNVDFILLHFTDESKEVCAEIISAYKKGKQPSGEFTRGLYYRGTY